MNRRNEVHIASDTEAAVQAAAAWWEAVSSAAIRERGVCHVALAGGSTPRALYEVLASPLWSRHIDWSRHYFWFGDERCVPPDHPDSNYRMARETLLSHIAVDAERIHRMRGEIDPSLAAREYEDVLRRTVAAASGSVPALDLVLLGIGTDGHVASLFPDTDILGRRGDLVAAVWVPKLASWRISLTLPLINAARRVGVLATGAGKAEIIARVIDGDDSGAYPAQLLRPENGVEWFLDEAAAAGIERESRT